MQSEQGISKVVMTGGSNMPVPQLLSMTGDLKIQRTRKVLLIILGILLALSLISTITAIYGNRIGDGIKETHGGMQFGQSLISVLFYGFGIFVAYRYYETGLRVFAGLSIIILITMAILIVFLLFAGIAASATGNFSNDDKSQTLTLGVSIGILAIVLACIARLVLTVTILSHSFLLILYLFYFLDNHY
ncbi:unnamed protein product [Rotaria sp. Silwood1]|nr:unnamed protein product [Rotaria sp. Silwood1]